MGKFTVKPVELKGEDMMSQLNKRKSELVKARNVLGGVETYIVEP